MKDLLVITADGTMKASVEAILGRHRELGIRQIVFDIYDHPRRDPGVFHEAQEFLRPFLNTHRFAMVMFDREGCGSQETASALARAVQNKLDTNGWGKRSAVMVLDPELEIWVWSRSPRVAAALGWTNERQLWSWLEKAALVQPSHQKPIRPKEAMEAALERVRLPRSTAIYKAIARTVELGRCTDATFALLRQTLQGWFPRVE